MTQQPTCHGCGGCGWVTTLYGSVQVCIICAGTGVAKAEFIRPKPSVPMEGPFVSRPGTDCSKRPPWADRVYTSEGIPPLVTWNVNDRPVTGTHYEFRLSTRSMPMGTR